MMRQGVAGAGGCSLRARDPAYGLAAVLLHIALSAAPTLVDASEPPVADDNAKSGVEWVVAFVLGLPLLILSVVFARARTGWQKSVRRLEAVADELRTQMESRSAELRAARHALDEAMRRMDMVLESERLRIARDLHDELGTTLTALQLELAGGSRGDGALTARRRRAGADLVDVALQAMQKLVTGLRPTALDRFGLWEAMRWRAQTFEIASGTACSTHIPDDLAQPSDEVGVAIFRIVDEALLNAARHAAARHVQISVVPQPTGLTVEIADDGCGIETAPLHSADSFGLIGMRERAHAIGAHLYVGRRDAIDGTVVRLQLPQSRLARGNL